MLDKFAQELKEAREKADISLHNLSARSRLDIKFLESMEKGDFSFLPELYVKAFIKDYANLVGLNADETIKKYEAAKKGIDYTKSKEEVEIEPKPVPEKEEEKVKEEPKEKLFGEQQKIPILDIAAKNVNNFFSDKQKVKITSIIAGIILIVITALLIFSSNNEPEIIVKEKPYEEVRKENQQRFVEENIKAGATIKKGKTLSLLISSTDTSWIKVQSDTNKPREFMLYPGSKVNLTSYKRFKMIIGNSGSVSLNLNNTNLDFSGKDKVVRYLLITKDGINYLKTEPTFTNN